MKSTLNIATAAMMRPLGEMLFGNGREQGMAAGANMVRSLAAADYDQARAQGQQRRNYMQSNEGLGELARAFGGDFSGYNLDGLDPVGQQRAKDGLTATLQALALPGDTNYQQLAKGRQDMAVLDAAVYGKNPTEAATLAAAFNNGKLFDNGGNGQTFNVATGQMRDSGLTRAIMGEKAAQAQYNLAGVNERNAHAGLYGAQTEGVRMDNQEVPLGNMVGGGRGFAPPSVQLAQIPVQQRKQLTFNSPEIDGYAAHVEQQYGLPPGLIMALKNGGERSNSWQKSPKGAQGVMQFIPSTWAQYGRGDPTDPVASIDASGRYLADMMKRYNGNVAAVVTEYNGGIRQAQHVAKGGKPWMAETAAYLPRVMNYLQGGGSGVRRKYAEPLLAKQATGEEKVTPLSGQLGSAFQIQLTGPDGRPMMDINDKPIMGDDTDSRQRFYRWMNASGNRDMNAALIQWEAQGRPDVGGAAVPQIPEDSLAGRMARAAMSGILGGAPQAAPQTTARASSPKVDNRITSKAIMEQAQLSHANPGMVVAQLRKNGIDVPQTVLAELKRQGFAVN